MLFLIELLLSVIAVPLAGMLHDSWPRWIPRAEAWLARIAANRRHAVLAVLILALLARIAVLPVEPIPSPAAQDEFGYLLMSDTFAHGRLTNPTHPLWKHFESMTIIQKPTYCSAFYPVQGIVLAFGKLSMGHPFWGVWLSIGLMCASICWALQGWIPPGWAFLGGILAIVRVGIFTYWADGYYGGAATALGGALALGALPRMVHRRRIRDALVMGLGLVLVAGSRPYEGLFFSTPILIALVVWTLRKHPNHVGAFSGRALLPLSLTIFLAAGALGYYFWRTTGSPFRPPYVVNLNTYLVAGNFSWEHLRPVPHYNHQEMHNFYVNVPVRQYEAAREHPVTHTINTLIEFWAFFLAPLLSVPLLAIGLVNPKRKWHHFPTRKTRFFLVVCAACGIGNSLPVWYAPHYSAPMFCALYGVVVQSFRHLRPWHRKGRTIGLSTLRTLTMIAVLLIGLRCVVVPLHVPIPRSWSHAWFSMGEENLARVEILKKLSHTTEQHLVIVHYSANYDGQREWVYNDADIDASRVIWAREMSPAENEQLVDYFKNRQIWLLDADAHPPKLSPYVKALPY